MLRENKIGGITFIRDIELIQYVPKLPKLKPDKKFTCKKDRIRIPNWAYLGLANWCSQHVAVHHCGRLQVRNLQQYPMIPSI